MTRNDIADREPCPWRIVDDIGGAFCMGAIGGGIFHTIKGSWNAPKGSRIHGAVSAMAARGPVLGGQFAVWGGLFACCDCSLTAIRQKEDPWNSICSGAATGGILAARAGPKAMASAAVVGGVLLALIEGMGIMFTKMMSPPLPTPEDYAAAEMAAASDVTAPPTAGGLMMPTAPPSGGGGGGGASSDPFAPSAGDFGAETTFSSEGG
eukprot:CAMPEP_0197440548 /NCGR_PEP_ID=MMETSP1175-20131217/7030_1 /TAXON_ID=1003142 /ORGANISM="Triceratium dubium, Strain CCMP147" /LENGTH=207 /DNA_ID=CAMNT_0042970681 /DNA_START=128 /DNA_END=747 /DNA_ORIENTATION=+